MLMLIHYNEAIIYSIVMNKDIICYFFKVLIS